MADLQETRLLSANGVQTGGKVVALTAVSQVLHTCVGGTTEWDAVSAYVSNTTGGGILLVLTWGGVTVESRSIGANTGFQTVLDRFLGQDGVVLAGTGNGLTIKTEVQRYGAG